MSLDLVRVKEEGEWGVSEAAARAGLYEDHEVKEELVLGPEVLQPPDFAFALRDKSLELPEQCAADAGGEQTSPRKASTGGDTAAYEQHKVKQELVHREPPMVDIPNLFFDDLHTEPNGIKKEPHTATKGTYNSHTSEKLHEKYFTQYKIRPCTVRLFRINQEPNDQRNSKHTTLPAKKSHKPKRFTCDYCRKAFSIKQCLLVHIRIHTGEKPFSCDTCKKKFSDVAILIRHRRIHTGEKPHTCDVCDKSFSEKYLLRYHKRIHTGGYPYTCHFCNKTYNHISNFKRHLLKHESKPFVCEICDTHFSLQSKLEVHLLSHSKNRPFVCGFCQKRFVLRGHLNRHLNIHLSVKRYSCAVCETKFSQKESLKKHLERQSCGKK